MMQAFRLILLIVGVLAMLMGLLWIGQGLALVGVVLVLRTTVWRRRQL